MEEIRDESGESEMASNNGQSYPSGSTDANSLERK
jgi:hypothetical protein